MLNMNWKLEQREKEGKIIKVGIVGAGQMGRGMVTQMVLMKGMTPAIVSDINVSLAVQAFKYAEVTDDEIVVAKSLEEANAGIAAGKYVACGDAAFVSAADGVDAVIDCTGVPDVGAKVATDAMTNGKHVVMLNVETDVVIGPYLDKFAKDHGVIYTGSAGDEPGAVMELYCFAKAMGLNVEVMGKGKNNKLDYECNPDTVLEEATRRKMSPRMLCAFKDGTKTMVEMTAMCNYTGLIPDVIGGHGPATAPGTEGVKQLNEIFKLKKDGGILDKHGVVEYGEKTCVAKDGLVAECITRAKIDLKAGQNLDGIGGYTTLGSICTEAEATEKGYVPFGLINKNAVMKVDCKKGDLITYDMVELDKNTLIYKLRKEQDAMYGKHVL